MAANLHVVEHLGERFLHQVHACVRGIVNRWIFQAENVVEA
ncbi:hypothetical protein [Corynebacterium durum]|nr:hypothetical protein [Corynebacterium durum]MDO4651555.1 hypothetical protein [Corynebacterium durum]